MPVMPQAAKQLKGSAKTIVAYCSFSKREIQELELYLINHYQVFATEYLINTESPFFVGVQG